MKNIIFALIPCITVIHGEIQAAVVNTALVQAPLAKCMYVDRVNNSKLKCIAGKDHANYRYIRFNGNSRLWVTVDSDGEYTNERDAINPDSRADVFTLGFDYLELLNSGKIKAKHDVGLQLLASISLIVHNSGDIMSEKGSAIKASGGTTLINNHGRIFSNDPYATAIDISRNNMDKELLGALKDYRSLNSKAKESAPVETVIQPLANTSDEEREKQREYAFSQGLKKNDAKINNFKDAVIAVNYAHQNDLFFNILSKNRRLIPAISTDDTTHNLEINNDGTILGDIVHKGKGGTLFTNNHDGHFEGAVVGGWGGTEIVNKGIMTSKIMTSPFKALSFQNLENGVFFGDIRSDHDGNIRSDHKTGNIVINEATFALNEFMDLSGGKFMNINGGTLKVGRFFNQVATADLVGDYYQDSLSTMWVDINLLEGKSDLLRVSGHATFDLGAKIKVMMREEQLIQMIQYALSDFGIIYGNKGVYTTEYIVLTAEKGITSEGVDSSYYYSPWGIGKVAEETTSKQGRIDRAIVTVSTKEMKKDGENDESEKLVIEILIDTLQLHDIDPKKTIGRYDRFEEIKKQLKEQKSRTDRSVELVTIGQKDFINSRTSAKSHLLQLHQTIYDLREFSESVLDLSESRIRLGEENILTGDQASLSLFSQDRKMDSGKSVGGLYSYGEIVNSNNDAKARTKMNRFGVKLGMPMGPLQATVAVIAGKDNYNITRHIPMDSHFRQASADVVVNYGMLNFRLSKQSKQTSIRLEPTFDLGAIHLSHDDDILERGAGTVNLSINKASQWIYTASPSLSISMQSNKKYRNDWNISANARAGMIFYYGDDLSLESQFASSTEDASNYLIKSTNLNRATSYLSAKLNLSNSKKNVLLQFGYNGRFDRNGDDIHRADIKFVRTF
ncbi:MAG: hypothetical protein KZQ66_12300 [Candidatus Thiodiazotropha sp. (ex Lucinoma aequizonata)]|nr:hypothetical protein [Candidatus Thiodiazotropha sp. (ex Lucinoma aequizonata)]MCU7898171.1 hypothetical protein [Candidatus Thiodiazotropha sp. (ex Lucinoma aequizonata)]MCU7902668.1 hypothetical protein [Candidatus Thiodiazotropha sp. (ex Lucinoma aequizonata)]MCU7913747.1 hypothetical protein [Candidatus Thiodiazotropha sp. (ex Lucinoma aequizonata)]